MGENRQTPIIALPSAEYIWLSGANNIFDVEKPLHQRTHCRRHHSFNFEKLSGSAGSLELPVYTIVEAIPVSVIRCRELRAKFTAQMERMHPCIHHQSPFFFVQQFVLRLELLLIRVLIEIGMGESGRPLVSRQAPNLVK
jgi:hypothetical protein